MQIYKKKSKKSFIITAAVSAAILVGGLIAYIYAFDGEVLGWSNRTKSSETQPVSKTQAENAEAIKAETVDSEATKPRSENSSSTSNSEFNNGSAHSTDLTITASAQNASTYQIRVLIGTVTSDGTCTLMMTKGSTTLTKTAAVQPMADSSTCKGFNVPVSELAVGIWSAVVKFENQTYTGASIAQTVEIR